MSRFCSCGGATRASCLPVSGETFRVCVDCGLEAGGPARLEDQGYRATLARLGDLLRRNAAVTSKPSPARKFLDVVAHHAAAKSIAREYEKMWNTPIVVQATRNDSNDGVALAFIALERRRVSVATVYEGEPAVRKILAALERIDPAISDPSIPTTIGGLR